MSRVASIATIIFALVAIILSGHSSDAASTVEIGSDGVNQSRTLHEIVKSQRRFVLYNSRQLSGDCLDVCVPTSRTDPPVDTRTPDPTGSPSDSPTDSPSGGPSSSPTDSPSSPPTKSPSDSPSSSPTKSPSDSPSSPPTGTICKKTVAIDVCIAIDNSGSICTNYHKPKSCRQPATTCEAGTLCDAGGFLGGNSCCGDYRKVQDFAINYIENLNPEGTVSVVKFADRAEVISHQGDGDAIEMINGEAYTGGFTNTEEAITKCVNEVKDKPNPVVILVTDGTPTACTLKNSDGWAHHFQDNCSESSCDICTYGPPRDAAKKRANWASRQGVTLVPVVISSVSENTNFLEALARCPRENPGDCDVNDFKDKLHVEHTEDVGFVLENLVKMVGCEDE